MPPRWIWTVVFWLAVAAVLFGMVELAYQFITHMQPGVLDCTITWGRRGCS